ncbi:unnamed protein product [Polarella glacialis]|uniref:Integrase catalytic domain-containing protein n=1 Tax=Polarella glacialis TaxID=89957 RepID=A0A813GSG7_POLGL|nr:unnamed protein product [Polarella glacialis]
MAIFKKDDHKREIPAWDGHPAGWLTYVDEVKNWLLGDPLDVPYSIAARLVQKLSGPAKRIGNAMSDVELMPEPPVAQALPAAQARAEATRVPDGEGDFEMPDRPSAASRGAAAAPMPVLPAQDTLVQTRARLTAGVTRLIAKLSALQPKAPVQKGLTMREFTGTTKYWRRPGERVTDFIPRWDEGECRERLLSSLPDEHFNRELLKEKAIQFFPEMHVSEPRFRQGQQQPQSGFAARPPNPLNRRPWSRKFVPRSGQQRTTFETGLHETWADVQDDPDGSEADGEDAVPPETGDDDLEFDVDPADLQGVIRQELDALATEIEATGIDLTDLEAGSVESAASTLAAISDAFATVRDVRSRLKGKGKGKGKGKKSNLPPLSGQWMPPRLPGPSSRQPDDQPAVDHPIHRHPGKQPVSFRETIAFQKANTYCKVCGLKGHWAGDPQCAHRVSLADVGDVWDSLTCSVSYLADAEAASVFAVGPQADDNRGVADTACALSVCGARWWSVYADTLAMYGLSDLVTQTCCHERFRFGNGGLLTSALRINAPVVVAGTPPLVIEFCVVDSELLPLLLGRDFFEVTGALQAIFDQDTKALPQRLQSRVPPAQYLREVVAHMDFPLAQASVQAAGIDLPQPHHSVGPCVSCSLPSSRQMCSSCHSLVCYRCAVGRLCPACAYGVPVIPADDGCESLQVQEWRPLKTGLQRQLDAGQRQMRALRQMGLRPQILRQVLYADAARQVHSALSSAVHQAGKPPLLIEWRCDPNSELGQEFAAQGGHVLRLCLPDYDMSLQENVDLVVDYAAKWSQAGHDVHFWFSLPCTAWCAWQFVNANAAGPAELEALEEKRCQSRRMPSLAISALQQVVGLPHVTASFEWPETCIGCSIPEIAPLLDMLQVNCRFDGCRDAVCDRQRRRLKKPWRVQTTVSSLPRILGKRCLRNHIHGETRGLAAVLSGFYTPALVRAITQGLLGSTAFPVETEDPLDEPDEPDVPDVPDDPMDQDPDPDDEPGDDAEQLPAPPLRLPEQPESDPQVLLRALKQLRRNLGHPEARALARAIRIAGGSHQAIRMALDFKCPSCARVAEPRPSLPAQLRDRRRQFGDGVAVDLFTLSDTAGAAKTFLNCVDLASRYQIVCAVGSKSPAVVLQAFAQCWLIPFGIPQIVICDMGGEFNREFSEELSLYGCGVKTTAAVSPTQNAICERLGGGWKLRARAVCDEMSLDFNLPAYLQWLCAAIIWATNCQVNQSGYSPSQWVLGRGLNLPRSLRSPDLALHSRAQDDPTFARRLGIQAAAQRSLAGLRYSRALSRAFLARPRAESSEPSQLHFDVGDEVLFWRGVGRRKAKHSLWSFRWMGPAIVIGREKQNIWVSFRGAALKCDPRHCRHALPDELVPWSELLEEAGQEEEQPPFPPASPDDGPSKRQYFDMTSGVGRRLRALVAGWAVPGSDNVECRMRQATFRKAEVDVQPPVRPPAQPLEQKPLPQLIPDDEEEPPPQYGPIRFQQGGSTASSSLYDMLTAMATEWGTWQEFKANKPCAVGMLKRFRREKPDLRIIGMANGPDMATRCPQCVSSCPLYLVLIAASQSGWTLSFHDAAAAFLQSTGIDRLLLLRMPVRQPPPGVLPGEETGLEKGFYVLHGPDGPRMLVSTHVDDLAVARIVDDPELANLLAALERELHLRTESLPATYCGKFVQATPQSFCITQPRGLSRLEYLQLLPERRRMSDAPLTADEQTAYRSVVGQLLWLATQSRPDLAFEVSKAAQLFSTATVQTLLQLNPQIKHAMTEPSLGITIRRGLIDLRTASVVAYGDSAFANMPGEKSQYGVTVCLTHQVPEFVTGDFSLGVLWTWVSATVKRVVRSTLAAEAYAVSEAAEFAQMMCQLLTEITQPVAVGAAPQTLKALEQCSAQRPVMVITDSQNLASTVGKDATAVADKRLRIVVAMLRELFASPGCTLQWRPTCLMMADPLTKQDQSPKTINWECRGVESKSTAIQVQERRSLATNSLALSPRQYQDSPQFCKVPDMPVLLGSPRERPLTMCSVQEIKKVPEVYSVPAIDMLPSIPKYPQQFQRSKSEGQDKLKDFCWSSMSIPVVRTFIHFGTPQHLKRTRSNSV